MDASQHLVPVDSEVIVRTGGGGGWGDPLDREPELVRADVIEGFVSAEKARSEYAVVLNPVSGRCSARRCDAAATRQAAGREAKRDAAAHAQPSGRDGCSP